MAKKKIAILTGGGDAPGLNAVIYALTKICILKYDYEVVGYKFGYRGLYNNDFVKLDLKSVGGILHKGGTILYSSNKDNLFDYTVTDENGNKVKKDVSAVAIENLKKEGVDTLVVLGGDGTLTSARDFARAGVNVIGVPKTIDNDLMSTDKTFGFDTAINVVAEALGRIHTTAESHHRVIVVEVMGRNAGWIALYGGIAGSADVILLPEIPFSLDAVVKKIKERDASGRMFTIIVVSEGAKEIGGEVTVGKIVKDSPDPIRLGGIANKLSYQLEDLIGEEHEVRPVVLGHTQRGGETSPYDRILSTRYGAYAAKLIADEEFGNMVCLRNGVIGHVALEEVIGGGQKLVDPEDELVLMAKDMGIFFGDEELK
ncbi:ATP-dependent 6-phosphofructokinase [Chakrabartyella piscis]|uniref:6-phosphofructokinase n=1 Tax=Chakrabartyella piscis TaxID=2918914 RepID=UPI0029583EB0|nr:ATP-dependent 6-phosphofructokinase [Chakrabartyella piscis]